MTLATCEQTLAASLEIVMIGYVKKLGSAKLRNNPDKWKRVYKEVKVLRARIHKMNGETFFPLPLEILESVITKFDPNNAPGQ